MTVATDLVSEIQALKAERRAAILAHNYQIPAIQDLADVVADSLQMARRATELDAPLLVICGVQFMAETAAIANPDKRVVIPDLEAGCSSRRRSTRRTCGRGEPSTPTVSWSRTSTAALPSRPKPITAVPRGTRSPSFALSRRTCRCCSSRTSSSAATCGG